MKWAVCLGVCFNQGWTLFIALVRRAPLNFTTARGYSSQEQISHNSQVALHFGRKQQCTNGILHVEVGTVSGIPLAYVFLRGDNQVVQLLIEIVPGRPKGKAV